MNDACIFCQIANKEISSTIVYETDLVIAFKDIYPIAPIHWLIIPKQHIENMAHFPLEDSKLAIAMIEAVQQLQTKLSGSRSFKLGCNNGKQAGQMVFHLHWHFMSHEQELQTPNA